MQTNRNPRGQPGRHSDSQAATFQFCIPSEVSISRRRSESIIILRTLIVVNRIILSRNGTRCAIMMPPLGQFNKKSIALLFCILLCALLERQACLLCYITSRCINIANCLLIDLYYHLILTLLTPAPGQR